jgi:hypothetical protein
MALRGAFYLQLSGIKNAVVANSALAHPQLFEQVVCLCIYVYRPFER